MEESGEAKTSNEILSELFGAFNADPPAEIDKSKPQTEGDESDHSRKSKKSKHKKLKKKHKSKNKKHKKKHSSEDGSQDESSSSKVKKRKKHKERHKENKVKMSKTLMSMSSVNIELSANEVPMALEIMMDGTVGIKGDDGRIKRILDDRDNGRQANGANTNVLMENVQLQYSKRSSIQSVATAVNERRDESMALYPVRVQEVFEAEDVEQADRQRRGRIQIRNLKFSSVYQEAVRAVEERERRERERIADIEEGELSESTGSEHHVHFLESEVHDMNNRRSRYDSRPRYRSFINYHHQDIQRAARHRSSSRSRSGSANRRTQRTQRNYRTRPRYSREESSYRRRRSRTRSRSRSRTRSRSRSRGRLCYSGDFRRRPVRRGSSSSRKSYRSGSRDRRRSRSVSRRSRERRLRFDSSHKYHSPNRSRNRSRERHRSSSVEKIDKEKLLAIARKNALKLIDAGMVPGSEKLTTIKAGGKTVNELTEYCKKLSKKEALGRDITDSESEASDGGSKLFHHPFQVRDRPSSIVMNIKNSVPLPVKSRREKTAEQSKQLRLQFPVSSGTSHARTENDWIPVSPKRDDFSDRPSSANEFGRSPGRRMIGSARGAFTNRSSRSPNSRMPDFSAGYSNDFYHRSVYPAKESNHPGRRMDISTIVSRRLDAMRKLQENPNDSRALDDIHVAQREMRNWTDTRHETGAFTGSTGVRVLSQYELNSGVQAWAKRNQLTAATPVCGGMGMALLQKMGWQPGEGLGKNKEGTLEPLKVEIKMDKKGLVAPDESKRGKRGPTFNPPPILPLTPLPMIRPAPLMQTYDVPFAGKHPVSLLNEICSRRRFPAPQFELCFECGPDHKKNFLFKVRVNGREYTPAIASPNKKQAKAEAAIVCLKALGVFSNAA